MKRGLGDHHFDRVAELLDESLAELGVAEEARAEVLSVVGGTREDVLGR